MEGEADAAAADDVDDEERRRRRRARPWLPFALAIDADPEQWRVEVAQAGSAEEAAAAAGTELAAGGVRAVYELTAVIAHVLDEDEAEEAGRQQYEGHLLSHIKVPATYYGAQLESPVVSRPPSRGPVPEAEQPVAVGADAEQAPASPPGSPLPADAPAEGDSPPAATPGGTAAAAPAFGQGARRFEWLVFNDFHITPSLPSEVAELYGGQKVPVLLYFTRVDVARRADAVPPRPPRPVLTPAAFQALCCAPPVQPNRARLHRPSFVPLSALEAPHPGMLLGLDAEFVAYSPPEKVRLGQGNSQRFCRFCMASFLARLKNSSSQRCMVPAASNDCFQ